MFGLGVWSYNGMRAFRLVEHTASSGERAKSGGGAHQSGGAVHGTGGPGGAAQQAHSNE
jgi:hypothetical protein